MRIRKSISIFAVLVCVSSGAVANSFDTGGADRVIYKGRPLSVDIPIGQEKLIEFGKAINLAIPSKMTGLVKAEAIAGTIYISANEAFDSTRFRVRDVTTGKIMILDLSANSGATSKPLRVVDQDQSDAMAKQREADLGERRVEAPSVVAATRHAFQQVYAPDRLVEPLDGMHPSKLKNSDVIAYLVPGYDVLTKPLAQWRTSDGKYVTALYIKNLGVDRVLLDPRGLRAGKGWQTASFRDGVLAPSGRLGDATTLVVIADRSWSGSTEWLR